MELRRMIPAAGVFISVAALAAAAWLAFMGWKSGSLALVLWGLGMAIAAPAPAVATALARAPPDPDASAPAEVLFDAASAAETALRYVRLTRAHVCTLAAGGVVYGFCELIGMMTFRSFVIGYAIIAAAGLAGYLPWLRRGENRMLEGLVRSRSRLRDARMAGNFFELTGTTSAADREHCGSAAPVAGSAPREIRRSD